MEVCGKTDDYCKWYKDNLATCRVCFVTMCRTCMGDKFEEYCSFPYATREADLKSVCGTCDKQEFQNTG